MTKNLKLYRFPVYLQKSDWEYLMRGWEARKRRIRSSATWSRYQAVDSEISNAVANAYPDDDGDMKYALYLKVPDYDWLLDSLKKVPKAERDEQADGRIRREFSGACCDMTEVEEEDE
jgi:hypothetical protein